MGHYAKIDENNIVVQVIVAKKAVIDAGIFGDASKWIKTSYNTRQGVHYTPCKDNEDGSRTGIVDGQKIPDDKPQLRKNYAGIGFTYDEARDAFIPPKPFPSWVLDEDTCLWKDPVEGRFTEHVDPTWDDSMPITDYKTWKWHEGNQEWLVQEFPKWVGNPMEHSEPGDWVRNEDGSIKDIRVT